MTGRLPLFATILLLANLLLGPTNARVFYLENPEGRARDPILPVYDNYEQSSRDLDLAFSAGDSGEDNFVQPRKVYTVVAAPVEKPAVDVRDERPAAAYYKLTELPRRSYDDVVVAPERNRKLLKINNGNRGELILELRVIANNHESA